MSELAEQIRNLVDGCSAPVRASEAIELSRSRHSGMPGRQFITNGRTLDRVQRHDRPRSHRVVRWGAGVAVAAAVVGIVVFQVVPTSKGTTTASEAAAAEISRLADAVTTVPPLLTGQWYHFESHGLLSANVSTGVTTPGGTPAVQAQTSIPITLEEWSNATGGICTSQQFGTASFSDSANAEAWSALGLITTPSNQPATDCAAGAEAASGMGSAFPPVDVSNLTHDPATLAAQLASSSTGIQAIDRYAAGEPVNQAAFERLAILLVSPTIGQWSGFGQEMLQTMSLVPGVISLGNMTSHSGHSGIAFTAQTDTYVNPKSGARFPTSPPLVIIDSQSGAVLEARNLGFPVLFNAAQDFVGSSSALVYSEGASYGVTAQWIDPVGSLGVVSQAALPTWTTTYHIIQAVTKPSTTGAQIAAVVNRFLGNGNMDSEQSVSGAAQQTHDITIMGTEEDVQTVVSALTASNLFTSVTVEL